MYLSAGIGGGESTSSPATRVGGAMEADWLARARCRDTDPAIFFPGDGIGVQAAQRICAQCPVKISCLEYALADRIDHGVWGGTSERERRRILRHRRSSAAKREANVIHVG